MIGRLAQEARREQAFTGLRDFFETQRLRIRGRLKHVEEKVELARSKAYRETTETPIEECAIERRGHAQGHDHGVDWRERNV